MRLFHYRDKQREVDVILERHSGEVAGVEVKAAATPTSADFAGLRYLREKLDSRFKAGVVLYLGTDTLPFGEHLVPEPYGTPLYAAREWFAGRKSGKHAVCEASARKRLGHPRRSERVRLR